MKNIKQYEFAVEIARHRSISKASQSLNISQPTLSKYLQKLEAELGFELFDRTTYPLKITALGKVYLDAAQQILDINNKLKKEIDEIKNNKTRPIRIGISPSRAPYFLPIIVEEYKKRHPEGRMVVKERNTSQLKNELQKGELDVVISLLGENTRGFAHELLYSEVVILAAPQTMAEMDVLTILREIPIISTGSGLIMWKTLNLVLEEAGAKRPEIECQSIESALSLVKSGYGATLVPSYITNYGENKKLVFKKLPNEYYNKFKGEMIRKVCIFYRQESFLTEKEKDFIEVCKSVFT